MQLFLNSESSNCASSSIHFHYKLQSPGTLAAPGCSWSMAMLAGSMARSVLRHNRSMLYRSVGLHSALPLVSTHQHSDCTGFIFLIKPIYPVMKGPAFWALLCPAWCHDCGISGSRRANYQATKYYIKCVRLDTSSI